MSDYKTMFDALDEHYADALDRNDQLKQRIKDLEAAVKNLLHVWDKEGWPSKFMPDSELPSVVGNLDKALNDRQVM